MMVAAIATVDAKLAASLSYLVATRRQSLRRQKARSILLRSRYATASYGIGVFRDRVDGMTASVALSARRFRRLLASYPLSASSRSGGGNRLSNSGAAEMSALFPGPRMNATARPQRSVRACIFVVGPPRERPMA